MLSPAAPERAKRLGQAAEYARLAGDSSAARRILSECQAIPEATARVRAEALRTQGRINLLASHTEEACRCLDAAGETLITEEPERAAHVYCEAAIAALVGHDQGRALQFMMKAQGLTNPPIRNVEVAMTLVWGAIGLGDTNRSDDPVQPLAEALRETARDPDTLSAELGIYVIRQAWFLALPQCRDLIHTFVRELRDGGGLALLPFALYTQAYLDVRAGRLTSAAMTGAEASDLARAIDNDYALFLSLGVEALAAAWRGDETMCRTRAEEAAQLQAGLEVHGVGECFDALGHLELSMGNYRAAVLNLDVRQRLPATGAPDVRNWSLGELAEALIRLDMPLPPTLEGRIDNYLESDTSSAAALASRLKGMLLEDFHPWFERSAAGFSQAALPTEAARTLLNYGERLRRTRDKQGARQVLESAYAIFEACHAQIWAGRAAQEIAATGVHIQSPREPLPELTPREHHVANLVAEGLTNKDVALALFVSTKTVEAHLSRLYRKLNVRTRTQLANRYRQDLERSDIATAPTFGA